jgi:hypothetical protein
MAETPREQQLAEIRERIARTLGSPRDSGSLCYPQTPYEKGMAAGVTVALAAFDNAARATPEPAPTEHPEDCLMDPPPAREHGEINVTLEYAGWSKPLPVESPTEHQELELDPEVTEMLTEAIKRGTPEHPDTLESLPDSPSHWVKDRFLKAHPDTVRLETAQRCVEIADRVAFMGNPIRERAALDIIEAIKQEFGLDAAVAAEREEKP